MKKIPLLIVCCLVIKFAYAQKSLLAMDEHNKYIYYQVVKQQGSTDSLFQKALSFIKSALHQNKAKTSGDSVLTVKDKFSTYNVVAFVKHQNGVINCNLTIECKDSRYRFWFTDFVFIPFVNDRYGNFVPADGIEIPLENASAKIDKKELAGYLAQAGTHCQQVGDQLKGYMAADHRVIKPQPVVVKKIVTDKW